MATATAEICQNGREQVAVGVDPSRDALQLAILAPHSAEEQRLPLTPAALQSVDASIGEGQVQIGIEGSASCGTLALLHWLRQGYDVREVNPQVSKRLRECLSEAHTDESDAAGVAWSLQVHPRLPQVRITPSTAAWKRLTQARSRLVKTQTALLNQLHTCLAEAYGPGYKELFSKLNSKKALSFFQEFPTRNDALAAPERLRERLEAGEAEQLERGGAWPDDLYLETLRLEIRSTIELLLQYRETLKQLEHEMEQLSEDDADVQRLQTIPGVKTTLALTILGQTGRWERFRSHDAYAAYSGLAPAIWQSGKSHTYAKPRKRYNRTLKQAMLQLALTQLRVNPESRAYYDRKRAEGKHHWAALTALARQLSKVIYKMMTKGCPYDRKAT